VWGLAGVLLSVWHGSVTAAEKLCLPFALTPDIANQSRDGVLFTCSFYRPHTPPNAAEKFCDEIYVTYQ